MLGTFYGVARVSTWISGVALVLCAALVALEVVLRKAFSYSIGGVDEITSYVFAIGVAWSLAFTLLGRAHIRIDLVYARLAPAWRSSLDLMALASLLVVSGMLLWQAAATAMTSFEIGARSNTPLGIVLWVPQSLWVAGLAFFVAVIVALMAKATRMLARGQHRHIAGIIGIRTVDEEIRDET